MFTNRQIFKEDSIEFVSKYNDDPRSNHSIFNTFAMHATPFLIGIVIFSAMFMGKDGLIKIVAPVVSRVLSKVDARNDTGLTFYDALTFKQRLKLI